MSIWKSERSDTAKEIEDCKSRIESAKSLQGQLENRLSALSTQRLREIGTKPCPVCKADVSVGPLGYAGGGMMHNTVECQCGRVFSVNCRRVGPDPLNPASYEISELSHTGWTMENKNPSEMTMDEIELLIEFLTSMPSDALTGFRKNLLAKVLDEKLVRLAPVAKE
jgi:hypothetical protein